MQGFFAPSYAPASPSKPSDMTERTRASWPVYALGALCAGAIVAAVLLVGPASGSQATVTRTATAAEGVVQSTVSGSGNLQAASQLDLGFKTSGVVSEIYVSQGQHVTRGSAAGRTEPQERRSHARTVQGDPAVRRSEPRQVEENDGETSTRLRLGLERDRSSRQSRRRLAARNGIPSPAPAREQHGARPPRGGSRRHPVTPTTPPPPRHARRDNLARQHRSSDLPTSSSTTASSSSTSKEPESARPTREANIASARAAVQSDRLTVKATNRRSPTPSCTRPRPARSSR